MTNLDSILKSRDIIWLTKVHIVKAMIFPVVTYGCKNWIITGLSTKELMLLTMVLEKTLESSLDCKEIKLVNRKANQPWIFIRRTDAEAPILWLPDAKSWLIGNDPDGGKDWGQEEKGMTEDEISGWHHWFNGLEFVQPIGDGKGQGSLSCCSPWGLKSWDLT